MRIYLDNNATTPIHPAVLATLGEELARSFANPSSVHQDGQRARRTLEEAREVVSSLIHAEPRDLVFTSGGTESNNAAIFGAALSAGPGCHIVTTAIEHPSVLEAVRELERRGFSATFVPCDERGLVDARAMIEAVRPDTRLVAMMLANNETGVVQPVAPVGAFCRERGIHFHTDAVQACGKIPVDVDLLGADSVSFAAHKMHGPKGIGALWLRRGSELRPHLFGGAQERRRRAGTENAPLAAGFAVAARIALENDGLRVAGLRDRLERTLLGILPGFSVNGRGADRLPNTTNLLLPGHDAEGIVIALDLEGIAISTGSACSSGRVEPSHVLLAMGLSVEDAKSSVRISLSRMTTGEEVDLTLERMEAVISRSVCR